MVSLTVENLSYKVANAKIFGPLTISATAGSKVTLRGPSGGGKTTVIRILAGRLPASYAKELTEENGIPFNPYYVGVLDYTKFDVPLTLYIGPTPTSQMLAFHVSDFFPNADQAAMEKALDAVSLPVEFLNREPITLSSGEATRVLLATMIGAVDTALILDGPWGWIDPGARQAIATNFYESLRNCIVVESEGAFTVEETRLVECSVELGDNNSDSDKLRRIETYLRHADVLKEENDSSIKISGSSRLTNHDAEFRLEIRELILKLGQLGWVQGDNGAGKTTFARSIAVSRFTGPDAEASYILEGDNGIRFTPQQVAGYVSGRLPIAESGLRNSIRLLVNEPLILSRFAQGSDSVLDPLRPEQWSSSSILAVMGATLYQLALGRRLVFIDEPFSGATSTELHLATAIFRAWARMFHASILVISHLTSPPSERGEPIIVFSKQDRSSTVSVEYSTKQPGT